MKKIGVFTGSFNPFTKGHLDILEQAEVVFDEVIVAIGTNPGKKTYINRVSMIKLQLPGRRIEEFKGFLVDYIHELKNEGEIFIVRGLRNSFDLLYEINTLRTLEDMSPDVKSAFFVCNRKYEHISSSMVKSLESIQKGSGSEYLAKCSKFKSSGVPLVEKD